MTTENKDEIQVPEEFKPKRVDEEDIEQFEFGKIYGYNACLDATKANSLRIKCEQQERLIREMSGDLIKCEHQEKLIEKMSSVLTSVLDEAIVSGKIKQSTIKLIRESILKSQKG